jgi:hypothetical protein
MFDQDKDGQTPNDYPQPSTTTPQSPTSGPVVGMTPVPGHPGLYYNTAGVVFNGSGTQVDGYVNPATGAFQTGTPVTNPNTGIIQPPGTVNEDPVNPTTPPPPGPGPAPAPAPAPTGGPAPTFTPPPVYNNNGTPVTSYTAPPAFNYADFVAPDPNQLNNDPLFKYTMQREQDAISRRSAANGGLFTGGTYDALMRNAADITSAGYQHLYDRDLNTYQTNRGNAVQNYNTNYQTQYTDPYKYAYQGSLDAFNSQIHNFDQGRSYDWARTLFGEQQANDAFDHKFRIFSSL